MSYIGRTPTPVALTASDITDGIISEAKMADDAISLTELKAGTDGNIISYDTSGNPVAVATGTDGQVLTSSGAGAVCAFEDASGGITEVDVWNMSTQTYDHDDYLTTGWSRYTTLNGTPQGTGLTESSGVFTFPSTGVYKIDFQTYFWNSTNTRSYNGIDVRGTDDDFTGNEQRLALTYTHTSVSGDHAGLFATVIYDVTNTSDNKLKFRCSSDGTAGFYFTYLTTTKLMET